MSLRVLYYCRILPYLTHCVEMSGITYNKENNHKSDFFLITQKSYKNHTQSRLLWTDH